MSELPRSRCAQYPSQSPLLRSLGNLLKTAVLVNILFDGTSAICPKCAEMQSAHFCWFGSAQKSYPSFSKSSAV